MQMTPPVADIRRCARCQGDHDRLAFQPLANAPGVWRWWAPCPTNGQPILLAIEETPTEEEV